MTARALRVGVLLGDNLVEERVFSDAMPVTVGQSLRCRLSIPADGLPAEHALFVRDQGRWLLRPLSRMLGRLVQGETIKTELGDAPIALERGARGKLTIGDATILFQEVAEPARTPRPQLPASVKGTLADRIDRRLAVIVGGSLLVHLAIGAWAWATDREEPSTQTAQAYRQYRQDTYDITIPDDVTATTTQEPGTAAPVAPVQTPNPIVKPTRITTPSPTPRLPTTDDAERFAQILTGPGETPRGPGEMTGRLPGSDLDQQLADIRDNNRHITVGNKDNGFRTREREGIGDGREHIVDNSPTNLDQQERREEHVPNGRIDLRPKKTPPTGNTLTPEMIVAKIQTDYMPGLMRCYKKGLLGDSQLGGKVAVTFTVAETGKLADPTAHGVASDVDSCIASQMATWRFPQPKDKDGDPTDLDFAMTLALVPGQ